MAFKSIPYSCLVPRQLETRKCAHSSYSGPVGRGGWWYRRTTERHLSASERERQPLNCRTQSTHGASHLVFDWPGSICSSEGIWPCRTSSCYQLTSDTICSMSSHQTEAPSFLKGLSLNRFFSPLWCLEEIAT